MLEAWQERVRDRVEDEGEGQEREREGGRKERGARKRSVGDRGSVAPDHNAPLLNLCVSERQGRAGNAAEKGTYMTGYWDTGAITTTITTTI